MANIIDIFMHIDKNLIAVINGYGFLAYPLLFLVIFVETGIVIMPFLPGDSLIFAAGTFAGAGLMNVYLLFILLVSAAILGDSLNYFIGKYVGKKIVDRGYIKQEHMKKTESFYEKYGSKTIVFARFVPFVRTIAPFVAGAGKMNYSKFLAYNVLGGLLWIVLFLFAGFFFGNIPLVKNNFSIAISLIVFVSIIPMIIEYVRHKLKK